MARIIGVNIPDNKRIEIALSYIYGIGLSLSKKILKQAGVNPDNLAGKLTADEVSRLKEIIEKSYKVEGDLRQQISLNIKRLKEIGTHRGNRHSRHLPVRGQRTRTNSRTVRGNVRVTMGSGRKASAEKT